MQVEIVRHDRGADDADGHVQACPVVAKVRARPARRPISRKLGLRLRQDENLDEVADGDGRHQQQHDRLDGPHAEALQRQQQQHVKSGDDDRPQQRDVEEQVEGHRAAQHFGQVAGADGHFAEQPVGPARPGGIPVAAALRQVFAGDHPQPGGDDLHEDGHQAGQRHHPEQAVLELRAGLQVGAPVARVHVADADQDRRADEGPPLLPESGVGVGNGDGVMDALERDVAVRGGAKRSGIECCVGPLWC